MKYLALLAKQVLSENLFSTTGNIYATQWIKLFPERVQQQWTELFWGDNLWAVQHIIELVLYYLVFEFFSWFETRANIRHLRSPDNFQLGRYNGFSSIWEFYLFERTARSCWFPLIWNPYYSGKFVAIFKFELLSVNC